MKDHALDAVDIEYAGKTIAAIFREGPTVWSGKDEIGLASDSSDEGTARLPRRDQRVKNDGVVRKYVPAPWEEVAKDPSARDNAEMLAFYANYDTQ